MNFHIPYLLFTISVASAILLYLVRFRNARGSKPMILACVSSTIWMVGEFAAVTSNTFIGQFSGEAVKFVGVVSMPIALLVFVSRYCGKPLTLKHILYLSAVPIISYGMMITSLQHQLFFKEFIFNSGGGHPKIVYGNYFWLIHLPYSCCLIMVSLGMLLFELNKISQRFRTQITLLIISICIPLAFNIINLSGIVKGFLINPIGLLGFLVVATIGIFRFQLFHGSPIAYETVFRTSNDGVLILNKNDLIMDLNPAFARGMNADPNELVGSNVNEIFASWEPYSSCYSDAFENRRELKLSIRGNYKYFSVSRRPITNEDGEINGKIVTIRDVTAQKLNQITLENMAFVDPLTMLANRRKFEEEFERAVRIAGEKNRKLAILYFDLDSFKDVNDTMGHKVGDELLKHVAARIASILRKPDLVARLGGDEFAAILHNASEPGVKIAVERILENTRTPFRIMEHTLVAELSIGAAFYPEHGDQLSKLLNHSDTAMYRAKSEGGGFALFDQRIDNANIVNM